jgi:hypothetical protein
MDPTQGVPLPVDLASLCRKVAVRRCKASNEWFPLSFISEMGWTLRADAEPVHSGSAGDSSTGASTNSVKVHAVVNATDIELDPSVLQKILAFRPVSLEGSPFRHNHRSMILKKAIRKQLLDEKVWLMRANLRKGKGMVTGFTSATDEHYYSLAELRNRDEFMRNIGRSDKAHRHS